jgi:hypothetical protein
MATNLLRTLNSAYPSGVSVAGIVLLAFAIVLLAAVEWPLISRRLGFSGRGRSLGRLRTPHKPRARHLRVVEDDDDPDDPDDFARSVERDLAQLPTIDEHDRKR